MACWGSQLAVGLVYYDEVGYFHDALFHALEIVSSGRWQEKHAHVNSIVNGHLALPEPDSLNEHDIVATGLAQQDHIVRVLGETP